METESVFQSTEVTVWPEKWKTEKVFRRTPRKLQILPVLLLNDAHTGRLSPSLPEPRIGGDSRPGSEAAGEPLAALLPHGDGWGRQGGEEVRDLAGGEVLCPG